MRTILLERAELRVRGLVRAGMHVAVVVPCYHVEPHIEEVVASIPDYIQSIVLVNDASRDGTGALLDRLRDPRVHVIHHQVNVGVGGAMLTGMRKAVELGADVIVKIDGDGQMDPAFMPQLIEPLALGKADYAKGNRFRNAMSLRQMPVVRRFGNAALSFMTKVASGYWNVFDPTNGYLAMRSEVLEMLPLEFIHRRYFFESSMLIALGIIGAVVRDVPMPARYGLEVSNLRIGRVLFEFPWLLNMGFFRRLWYRKILYSFTMEALFGVVGFLLTLVGVIFGAVEFYRYAIVLHTPAPAGTVMTAALPIVLGTQMMMNAVLLDIQAVPTVPLCEKIDADALE